MKIMLRKRILLFFIIGNVLLVNSLQGQPWGKDADIALFSPALKQSCPSSCKITTPIIGPIAEALINFHQQVISPADGPRSCYFPSSSQYTLEAMYRYGFVRGWLLGCDRLMRENDETWVWTWISTDNGSFLKHDPVPNL